MGNLSDQKRNLNPIPAARVARIIWGHRYSLQGGGTMDFWDSLSPHDRRRCELVVKELREKVFNDGR